MARSLAEQFADAGDFRRAAEILATAKEPPELALRAWSLFELGNSAEALRIAGGVLVSNVSAVDRARCLAVAGRAKASLGLPFDGLALVKKAVTLAALHDTKREAEHRAQYAAAALNWVGVEPALAELPTLRRVALEGVNHSALAEYHILYGRIAALRGWWQKAKRELQAAEDLLVSFPHLAMQWRLEQSATSISVMNGDVGDALRHGEMGLKLAEEAGSRTKIASALANLANVWSILGNYKKATTLLQKSHQLLEMQSHARFATLSTGVTIGLRTGDNDYAREMVACGEALGSSFEEDTYYKLWFALHRVTWLVHCGQYREAAAEATRASKSVRRLADTDLARRMALVESEARFMLGERANAFALLADIATAGPQMSLEVIAELERVGAVVCGADSRARERHLAAAERVLGFANLVGPKADVGRTRARLSAAHTRAEGDATRLSDVGALLERVTLILRLGRYPRVLACESFALIESSGLFTGATLAEIEGGVRTELQSFGPTHSNGTPTHRQRVELLERNGAIKFLIEATPRDKNGFPSFSIALQQLVTASLAAAWHAAEAEPPTPWPFEAVNSQDGMVVGSDALGELLATARRLAPSNITVLVTGETGTGKELLARVLHDASPRSSKPFVPFNCSAVSRDMLDAQLFGYRRGAFTGAQDAFEGVIRAAAGGTLFLDEIGEVALDVQPKLLRFLEAGEIHPLGEPRPIHVDVRVVAATNADLETLVEQGRFREDLFYRLNVVPLHVPPLRERREEIPPLVQHYLDKCSREAHKSGLRVADETMEYLILYRWPGNVRQLANEMRRMVALAETGAVLMPEHLSRELAASRRTISTAERVLAPTEFVVRVDQPMSAAMEHVERAMIQYALTRSGGRVEDAASRLGLSRKGLYLKRQRLGLTDTPLTDEEPVATV